MAKIKSHISGTPLQKHEAHRGDFIRKEILAFIQKDYPDFGDSSYISIAELNHYRKKYLVHLVTSEKKELNELEQEVLDAVSTHKILSENIEEEIERELNFSERVADAIATFGGSWLFIGSFFAFILFWVISNMMVLATKPFDPYPFILLNLLLSCLAAIQAPIILMSQNRVEDKDRKRGEHDFQVNLKAELEIYLLNEKIDHLVSYQNKRLLEIQELQTDYLEDILAKLNSGKK